MLSWAIWFWRALYSSFFLTWLSLTLKSSILVSTLLKRVLVFLELNLAVLQCLLGGFQLGLPVGEGRLAGGQCPGAGSQSISQRLGTLMQQVKVAEVVGRRGHQSRFLSHIRVSGDLETGLDAGSIRFRSTATKNPRRPLASGGCFSVNRCSRGSPRAVDFALGAEVSGRPWPRSGGHARA